MNTHSYRLVRLQDFVDRDKSVLTMQQNPANVSIDAKALEYRFNELGKLGYFLEQIFGGGSVFLFHKVVENAPEAK